MKKPNKRLKQTIETKTNTTAPLPATSCPPTLENLNSLNKHNAILIQN